MLNQSNNHKHGNMLKKNKIKMILFVNGEDRIINAPKLLASPSNSGLRDYIGKITVGNIVVFDEDMCSILTAPLPNRICVVITSNKDFNRDGFIRVESIRDFMVMLDMKFDQYRDVYVMVDNIHMTRSFMGYVDSFMIVEDSESKVHERYELSNIPKKTIVGIKRSTNVVGEHAITDSIKITDHEFKDNVFMCTASVDGVEYHDVCAREPIAHVDQYGEIVRRK